MLNNQSPLEQLPQEIAKDRIASYLDKKELASIIQVSQTTHRMFQRSLQAVKAAKLLNLVSEAEYAKAEEMINADSLLMFQPVSYKKAEGNNAIISPLKFAFMVYDTYMWKMFYEKIKNNTEYVDRFTQQAHEQKEHINLERFFAAYETLEKKFDAEEDTDKAWLNVGLMQREILPRHMLKESCREDNGWSPVAEFNVDLGYPTNSDIYIFKRSCKEAVVPFRPKLGLGFNFSLIRGESIPPINAMGVAPHAGMLGEVVIEMQDNWRHDWETFSHLYAVRISDHFKLLSQLEPVAENRKKMT